MKINKRNVKMQAFPSIYNHFISNGRFRFVSLAEKLCGLLDSMWQGYLRSTLGLNITFLKGSPMKRCHNEIFKIKPRIVLHQYNQSFRKVRVQWGNVLCKNNYVLKKKNPVFTLNLNNMPFELSRYICIVTDSFTCFCAIH